MNRLLSIQERQLFEAQGYLLIEQVLNAQVFKPIQSVITSAIDEYAQSLYHQGQISDLYKKLPFSSRLTQISRQAQAGPLLNWNWNKQVFGPEIYQLIIHDKILNIVDSLIGPEITANGDYWIRFKMPTGDDSIFPWHQDSIYYNGNAEPDQSVILSEKSQILTVWIPMVEVNEFNGCLQIISGSHKRGLRPAKRDKNGRQVPVEDIERGAKIKSLKMKVGDICVFSNLTFHRSLANISKHIRWSIDLRYSPTGSPLEWFYQKWPGFVARSQLKPETVETWESWRKKRMISDQR